VFKRRIKLVRPAEILAMDKGERIHGSAEEVNQGY
jgi:hypothetical protein